MRIMPIEAGFDVHDGKYIHVLGRLWEVEVPS